MAARVYTSEAIVLRKYPTGEASLSALILTKEYGLIRVRAQGARKPEGKLKSALEPMTYGDFSFVEGRQGSRLVGAEARGLLLSPAAGPARQAAGQLARLLIRLIPGEAPDADVFELIRGGLAGLQAAEPSEVPALECAIVLALLMRLGYLPDDPDLQDVAQAPLERESLLRMRERRAEAVRAINRMLAASGL